MTARSPTISVVMSVYNGAATLTATLESILSQSDSDFEVVVVDDGSTDATAEILRRTAAADQRLRVLRQENRGLTAALIVGCQTARAPIIARHDCGDRSLPGRLAMQREI